jgi:demethylmenaquinone methyltransferase/2-methoxy-6-polyprenyl-1,4-benzoquinol methylase
VSDLDERLDEQVRYYRARAPEYDATAPAYESVRHPDDPYAPIAAEAISALRALGPVERAIELGAGTGQFTRIVASVAREVDAVDTSPEVLALNAANVPAPNVRRIVADAFRFVPARPADLVVMAALLSHVPRDRMPAFWAAVGGMLRPGGRAFVFDEAPHDLWSEEPGGAADIVWRTLEDGRRFRIVKVLWEPGDLRTTLAALRWRAEITRHDPFWWATVEMTGSTTEL